MRGEEMSCLSVVLARLVALALLLAACGGQNARLRRDLAEIRYHLTTCGSSGRTGPTNDRQCIDYYQQINSTVSRDNLILEQTTLNFRGGQLIQIPRTAVYNVTVAGATGGRGLCSPLCGRGLVIEAQADFIEGLRMLVLVGQVGQGPCDLVPVNSVCHDLPVDNATQCNETWWNYLLGIAGDSAGMDVYMHTGGGGGGGTSMIRLENEGGIQVFPYIVAGGGGGGAAVLDLDFINDVNFSRSENATLTEIYREFIDAKAEDSDSVLSNRRAEQGFVVPSEGRTAGAGGGYLSGADDIRRVDGSQLILEEAFAEGGTDCAVSSLVPTLFTAEIGGFGGGGGGCGGGGGGGGHTGGAIVGAGNFVPGGGGYSFKAGGSRPPRILELSLNDDGNGYVDIVAADCGCVYECVVYEEEDRFECLCPNDTQLAPDLSDCYKAETRKVDYADWATLFGSEYKLSLVDFGNSTNIFSIHAVLGPGAYYVDTDGSGSGSGDNDERILESSEGSDGVCVIAFIGAEEEIVLVSDPVQGGQTVSRLSQIEVNFTEGSVHMSEFTGFLSSPVLVTGAILISQGDCFIQGGLSLNISIQEPTSNNNVFDYPNLRAEIFENPDRTASVFLHLLSTEEDSTVATTTESSTTLKLEHIISIAVAGAVCAVIMLAVLGLVCLCICCACCNWNEKSRIVFENIELPNSPTSSLTPNAVYVSHQECCFSQSAYQKYPNQDGLHMNTHARYSLPRPPRPSPTAASANIDRYDLILHKHEGEGLAGVSPPPDAVIPPAHDYFNFNRARCHSTLHDANWQYPRSRLIFMRELGEGQFGKVLLMKAQSIAGYSGQLPVAVKTLSSRDPEMVRKFMEEAELMKKFSHQNIVSLLGISTDDVHDDDNAPLMILEYMPYGDLHAFLKKYRPNSPGGAQSLLSHTHFISFAIDVANALKFLGVLKYVHRDIAARNCLVGIGLRIKISDFGLARKINAQNFYKLEGNGVLPIRTMAPECFLSGVFTPVSDVWSYGVLLWEINTFGAIPLPGLSSHDIADQAQTGQLRHVIPPECPPVLSSLISQCHTHDPDQRPSFTDILETLTAELSSAA